MNDFISNVNLQFTKYKRYSIQKNSKKGSLSIEQRIDKDFPPIPVKNSQHFNIIYCYSLTTGSFAYPNGKSNVLYIGRTTGEKKSKYIKLGFRFKHYKVGKDNKSNICLRYYYDNNIDLTLEIYELPLTINIKDAEKSLRKNFLDKYNSLPIADGASYKK